jgi:hypothetical protein
LFYGHSSSIEMNDQRVKGAVKRCFKNTVFAS